MSVRPDSASPPSASRRPSNARHARSAAQRGELLLAGALTDPVDAAVLFFRTESPAPVEAFARADPYVAHGLVKSFRVREWTTVVGETAMTPILAKA